MVRSIKLCRYSFDCLYDPGGGWSLGCLFFWCRRCLYAVLYMYMYHASSEWNTNVYYRESMDEWNCSLVSTTTHSEQVKTGSLNSVNPYVVYIYRSRDGEAKQRIQKRTATIPIPSHLPTTPKTKIDPSRWWWFRQRYTEHKVLRHHLTLNSQHTLL